MGNWLSRHLSQNLNLEPLDIHEEPLGSTEFHPTPMGFRTRRHTAWLCPSISGETELSNYRFTPTENFIYNIGSSLTVGNYSGDYHIGCISDIKYTSSTATQEQTVTTLYFPLP